jgi:6-phosphofructokinase 1
MEFDITSTEIRNLGAAKVPSSLWRKAHFQRNDVFISDGQRVLIDVDPEANCRRQAQGIEQLALELAGPRSRIYFDPSKLRCAVVTCGGLCPGLNDIIRAVFLELHYGYGVRHVLGIRYGLQGFIPSYGHEVLELTPESVSDILALGGSILGSSRGPQPIAEIVDSLERMNVNALFMVGGDGTLVAATRIVDEITARGLKIAVVGIPKTIDNDIHMVARSFGFDTAVEVATQAIRGAHSESVGYPNGIGLIKLMGRHSGFIAATAALAQQDVNFVLIPEVDFDLEGPRGLLPALEERLRLRGHAVIVVAEGAGQKFFEGGGRQVDASGNVRLNDIGPFLKEKIDAWFRQRNVEISLKYIDPSYMIRSLPANANDHVFCSFLGRDAVHAAMAGKTRLLIGFWNNHFVHLPMDASAGKRKHVNPYGKLWLNVLNATGQGLMVNEPAAAAPQPKAERRAGRAGAKKHP